MSARLSIVLAALLLFVVGATAAWAVTTNGELDRTRTTLDTASDELDGEKSALAAANTELEATKKSLASEQHLRDAAKAKIPGLRTQIDRKSECIAAQSGNLAELQRILDLERKNFDRTKSTSAWGKAHAAADKAIALAIDYLYRAYQAAAAHQFSTANSWLSKSNAQIRVSNRQVDSANKQIRRINAESDAINKAQDAFDAKLKETIATCGA